MMFTIRPFEPNDIEYHAVVAVENAIWPKFPETVKERKHRDETRDPKYLFQRFVVEVEGEIVAVGMYCEPWWSMKPGKYFLDTSVHPGYRRQGIGTALYDMIVKQLAERNPMALTANTRESQLEAVHFLTRRGFKQVMRVPLSYLDVPRFDPAPWAAYPQRMTEQGIEIRPLADIVAEDPDWKRRFWELDWEIMQDVPSPDPHTRSSLEVFEKRVLESPRFLPKANFIALDGGRWIGMSGLWLAQAEPHKLYTGLTGVARSHRRRGIATAIKLRGIDFARRYGATVIETDNEEANPMYQINLKLGFEPQPAWLEFEKKLNPSASNALALPEE